MHFRGGRPWQKNAYQVGDAFLEPGHSPKAFLDPTRLPVRPLLIGRKFRLFGFQKVQIVGFGYRERRHFQVFDEAGGDNPRQQALLRALEVAVHPEGAQVPAHEALVHRRAKHGEVQMAQEHGFGHGHVAEVRGKGLGKGKGECDWGVRGGRPGGNKGELII